MVKRCRLIACVGLALMTLAPALQLVAQDIHFSQFYASPLTLNPGNVGNFTGNWRAMNINRNQWRSLSKPFVTTAVGGDMRLKVLRQPLNIGLLIFNDQSGNINLTVNKIFFCLGYEYEHNGHRFNIGVQTGFMNKNFSLDGMSFPDQWDAGPGEFNAVLAMNETTINNNIVKFDANAGITWKKSTAPLKPQAGIALFHINRPNQSYTSGSDRLPVRNVIHGGIQKYLTEKISLEPKLLYMSQVAASDLLIGSNLTYRLNDNQVKAQAVFGGLYFRNGFNRNTDAAFLVAGLNFKSLDVGISYDINISDLHVATSFRGAFEISIIYTSLSTVINKVSVPCDIY